MNKLAIKFLIISGVIFTIIGFMVVINVTITGMASEVKYDCNYNWPNSVVIKGSNEVVASCAFFPGKPHCDKNAAIKGTPQCCGSCVGYECTNCTYVLDTCVDSDEGKTYGLFGEVTGTAALNWEKAVITKDTCYEIDGNTSIPVKECIGSNCRLYETSCEENNPAITTYKCPSACKLGACVTSI